MELKKVALITGCSSGVGRALCIALKKTGYVVIASARELDKIKDLEVDYRVRIDVTDQKSINMAVSEVITQFGRIDILVNNAGYSVRVAVEEMNLNMLEQMFQVNVYGMVRMIQTVTPYMREQHNGKIINVCSVSGRLTTGINGGYCATKHAVEAISEAARYELNAFGIQVTILEPGAMETTFFKTLSKNSDQNMMNKNSPYYSFYQKDLKRRLHQHNTPVVKSVNQICKVIEKKHLKTRYQISLSWIYRILIHLPDSIKEKLIYRFG